MNINTEILKQKLYVVWKFKKIIMLDFQIAMQICKVVKTLESKRQSKISVEI
jgi:hypothetical protein